MPSDNFLLDLQRDFPEVGWSRLESTVEQIESESDLQFDDYAQLGSDAMEKIRDRLIKTTQINPKKKEAPAAEFARDESRQSKIKDTRSTRVESRPSKFEDTRSTRVENRPSKFEDTRFTRVESRPSKFEDTRSTRVESRPSKFEDSRSTRVESRPSKFEDSRSTRVESRPSKFEDTHSARVESRPSKFEIPRSSKFEGERRSDTSTWTNEYRSHFEKWCDHMNDHVDEEEYGSDLVAAIGKKKVYCLKKLNSGDYFDLIAMKTYQRVGSDLVYKGEPVVRVKSDLPSVVQKPFLKPISVFVV